MSYSPNLGDETRSGQKTSLAASVVLELGKPTTVMATDKEVFTLSVDTYDEQKAQPDCK